jgi:hypothetical protein
LKDIKLLYLFGGGRKAAQPPPRSMPLVQQISSRIMNDRTSKSSLGLRSCPPKFPAGSIFYTKYTTIGREQDASNKSCILTSQKQCRASSKFSPSRTRQLSDTRSCFDGCSLLVSGLIDGVEIEDWALTTSTQATNSNWLRSA